MPDVPRKGPGPFRNYNGVLLQAFGDEDFLECVVLF